MNYFPHTEDENGNILELNSMEEPVAKEQYYTSFFRTLTAIQRQLSIASTQKWEQKETDLN